MKKYLKGLILTILFTALSIAASFQTFADSDDEEIERVTIKVDAAVSGGGSQTLNVTSDETGYEVDSYRFTASGSYKVGDVPKVKVVLKASGGYEFVSNLKKSRVTIEGEGSCTDTERKSSGRSLEITVQLKPVAGTIGTVASAYWAGSPVGKAKWDAAENANAYEVKLYYKDSVIKRVDKTSATSYDFYSYMTKVGNYHFLVRTVPKNSDEATYMDEGEWVLSDELFIESSQTASNGSSSSQSTVPGGPSVENGPGSSSAGPAGSSVQSGTGSPGRGWQQGTKGWQFTDVDGSSPVNSWKLIEGRWYLFDMAGYMCTGWQKWNGGTYFLSVNGDMATGWLEQNRSWYYMGEDGSMRTGWITVNGTQYYLGADGIMITGWQLLSNRWYYFDPATGAMALNTYIGNYYVGSDGAWITQ